LKHRCVVAAIQVEIENPRRFVKTINFYFSPRPVDNASSLKSTLFESNWQPCGTLTLTRGATRESLNLSTPVVAANIKIEYADFFERPGTTKASDGTLVIHCPRCTRVVTNAHGVCNSCGEVAFQCRKCRHINYDRLDAFLCVECGFCASGTFQYDLTAAVATNAVAIMNDRDYVRSVQRTLVASQLHKELRTALLQKLLGLVRTRKRNPIDHEAEESSGNDLLPSFKRAFSGALPLEPGEFDDDFDYSKLSLNQLGKPGSIVKTVAQTDAEPKDRPQSLFRTGLGDSFSHRGRTESLLMQGHLSSRTETASELLGGLLDGTSSLSRFASLDPEDPLSRLLASVQSRRERRETDEQAAGTAAASGAPATGRSSSNGGGGSNSKETLDVCDRLYQLMREAEREAHELEVRCAAWRRLERGNLSETDGGDDDDATAAFEPSHCSMCAVTMAANLLVLWLRTFQLDPDAVVIDNDLIALLLNDDPTVHLRNLSDTKRSAVKEIAILSKQGRPLILEALRLRLILLQDLNVAEIVGKILQALGSDSEAAAPFMALAQEALESGLSL
jgi:hypothetical protein